MKYLIPCILFYFYQTFVRWKRKSRKYFGLFRIPTNFHLHRQSPFWAIQHKAVVKLNFLFSTNRYRRISPEKYRRILTRFFSERNYQTTEDVFSFLLVRDRPKHQLNLFFSSSFLLRILQGAVSLARMRLEFHLVRYLFVTVDSRSNSRNFPAAVFHHPLCLLS